MRTWRFPELLLGFLLCAGVVGVGWSLAAFHDWGGYRPAAYASNASNQAIGSREESLWQRTMEDPEALYSLGVAVFTAVLGGSTIGLWFATSRTARLARDEFLATHRPQVIVRLIQYPAIDHDRDPAMVFSWVTVVNVGATDATITHLDGVLAQLEPGPGMHLGVGRFLANAPVERPIVLRSGQRQPFTIFAERLRPEVFFQLARLGGETVFATGVVRYRDGRGVERETRFFRNYDFAQERFIPSEDPEREYAD